MKSFQASAPGHFLANAPTPRQAAARFFERYPTKRKCSIIEGENRDDMFVVTYGHPWPQSWKDVTPKGVCGLPDEVAA